MADEFLERTVFRKVTLRLMPFLCLIYFFNILDRANIDFARLQMLKSVGISKLAYGLGAGIFSIGYCVLEVPSNLILSRVGARRWMARIMISWGLISASMMFVVGPWSFCVLRFLLGCAEAGFFPGILLYLTYWYPARQRARAVALFMAAAPLTWVVGGPLSGALLDYMHESIGLAGWQWLFLLEGLPTVLLGVVTLFYLTDRPAQARWLTPAERTWLTEHLAAEEQARQRQHGWTLRQAISERRVWHLVALATTIAFGISGLAYFFAPLLKDRFASLSSFEIGLLKAVAGICTLLAMVAVGLHSMIGTGERRGTLLQRISGGGRVGAEHLARSAGCQLRRDGVGAGGHDEHVGAVLVAGDGAPRQPGRGGRHRADQRPRQLQRLFRADSHGLVGGGWRLHARLGRDGTRSGSERYPRTAVPHESWTSI